MAHQVDRLIKIGKEGFSLRDEMCGRKKKQAGPIVPTPPYQLCQYAYWGPEVITVQEPVIDSNMAAQVYGGKLVVDYWIGKPISRANY